MIKEAVRLKYKSHKLIGKPLFTLIIVNERDELLGGFLGTKA